MEPSRASIAAPRRALSEAEKAMIADAVLTKLSDHDHHDFRWLPLVVAPHDRAMDYCARVSGYLAGEYGLPNDDAGFRDFRAHLTFDRNGALAKVEIVALGKARSDNTLTMVDSICMQGGYDIFQ